MITLCWGDVVHYHAAIIHHRTVCYHSSSQILRCFYTTLLEYGSSILASRLRQIFLAGLVSEYHTSMSSSINEVSYEEYIFGPQRSRTLRFIQKGFHIIEYYTDGSAKCCIQDRNPYSRSTCGLSDYFNPPTSILVFVLYLTYSVFPAGFMALFGTF